MNKLKEIKLGAPKEIIGGPSPDAEFSIESVDNLERVILHDDSGMKCTNDGAMGAFSEILRKMTYIKFEDPEVERILMEHNVSSDGIGITLEDAYRLKSIEDWFKGNTNIEKFNELPLFGVDTLEGSAFEGCVNLKNINIKNINTLKYRTFESCDKLEYLDVQNIKTVIGGPFMNPLVLAPLLKLFYFKSVINNSINFIGNPVPANLKIEYGAMFFPSIEITSAGLYCGHDWDNGTSNIYGNTIDCLDLGKNYKGGLDTGPNGYVLSYVPRPNIICRALLAPSNLQNIALGSTSYGKLFVPAESIELYKTTSPWSNFGSSIYAIGGTEWQSYNRSLAEKYASTYNKDFDIENADYSQEYVDYDIFGLPRPE